MAAPAKAQSQSVPAPAKQDDRGLWETLNDLVRPLDSFVELLIGPPVHDAPKPDAERADEHKGTELRRVSQRSGPRQRKIPRTALDLEKDVLLQAQEAAEQLRMEQQAAADEEAAKSQADRGNKQLIVQTFLAQIGMLYGMTQGSLLLLFVPTKCPKHEAGTTTLFTYTRTLPSGHVCTMQEVVDFDLHTPWGNAVLLMNFVTLIGLIFSQIYFWRRELFFINKLEEDQTKPYSALPVELEGYDDIKEDVDTLNAGAFNLAKLVATSVTANFVMVCVLLYSEDEDGWVYSTGPGTTLRLICNVLLILPRVYGYLRNGRTSKEKHWAISFFTQIPSSFNTIDEQYKQENAKPDFLPGEAEGAPAAG